MVFPGFVRPMQAGEEAAVDALLRLCFDTGAEAGLVGDLRKSGDMAGEMVLPLGEDIIGYYALSQMRAPEDWLCVAPVAVHPDHQRQGHGRRMLGQLTAWAVQARQYVVVLGDVELYARCGFDHGRAQKLTSPYPITHTLLAGPGEDVPEATLIYPKAFGAP